MGDKIDKIAKLTWHNFFLKTKCVDSKQRSKSDLGSIFKQCIREAVLSYATHVEYVNIYRHINAYCIDEITHDIIMDYSRSINRDAQIMIDKLISTKKQALRDFHSVYINDQIKIQNDEYPLTSTFLDSIKSITF